MKEVPKDEIVKEGVKLLKDKETFRKYVDYFHQNIPRDWEPLLGDYRGKVIERIRSCAEFKAHSQLFVDKDFLASAYKVLKEWIEFRKAKMIEEEEFKKVIKENSEHLSDLVHYKLHEIKEDEWNDIKNKLESTFKRIRVMKTERQLMGVSKTLHFLLPDLVPPMDVEYIQRFFGVKISVPWKQEPSAFIRVLEGFYSACKNLKLTTDDLNPQKWEWNTSVPKMIDNAIVGYWTYVKEHLPMN